MKVVYTDPDVEMNLVMREPYQVVFGSIPEDADVTLMMKGRHGRQVLARRAPKAGHGRPDGSDHAGVRA